MPPIIIKSSRLKYLGLLMLSLGFVALGVLLLRKGQPAAFWAGWANIVFFGAGAVLFVRQIIDARPRVVIDAFGVFDRTLGVGVIPWSALVDARLQFVGATPFICLELHESDGWRLPRGPITGALTRSNTALGCSVLNLNLGGLRADPSRVLAAVQQGITRHAPRSPA